MASPAPEIAPVPTPAPCTAQVRVGGGGTAKADANKQFTIGAGANTNAFPASGTRVDVNGPDGHLVKAGSGTTSSDGAINVDGGTVTIGAGDRVGGFSKGMQQRLGLAQAILHRPDLVLLDEPSSALDPVGRREVRDLGVDVGDRARPGSPHDEVSGGVDIG